MQKFNIAERKMLNFIGKRFTGSAVTISKHRRRSLLISIAISERFGVHIYQYQQKHYLWFLNVYIADYSSGTRYNYYLTVVKLIQLEPKFSVWKNQLALVYKRNF
jgi:predicted AAA+ superfamily ATPase